LVLLTIYPLGLYQSGLSVIFQPALFPVLLDIEQVLGYIDLAQCPSTAFLIEIQQTFIYQEKVSSQEFLHFFSSFSAF
jgi:hypothetical protein